MGSSCMLIKTMRIITMKILSTHQLVSPTEVSQIMVELNREVTQNVDNKRRCKISTLGPVFSEHGRTFYLAAPNLLQFS